MLKIKNLKAGIEETKILNGIVGIISVVRTLIWRSLDVKHRHESLRP